MKERPILFNAEMVKAILSGRKTQTRRVMKRQPEPSKTRDGDFWFSCDKMQTMVHVSEFIPGNSAIPDGHEFVSACCPIGAVGNQLWVRETFASGADFGESDVGFFYRATDPGWDDNDTGARWRPSIHMPRAASRIDLLITGVRVERLNSLTIADAKAEGYPAEREIDGGSTDPWLWFRDIWDGIYPDNTFKVNPWVWVIEFERVAPAGERS